MRLEKEFLFLNTCSGAIIEQKKNIHCCEVFGSAILASAAIFSDLPPVVVEKTGCGALPGDKNGGIILATLGRNPNTGEREEIFVVETSIDDMNPEFYPYAVEEIFKAGALDVFLTPLYMKKGRPGVLLTALCKGEQKDDIIATIFRQTTTLGVRIMRQERQVLCRKSLEVDTPYGKIRIKLGYLKEGEPAIQIAPEYEDCRRAAASSGAPVKEVYQMALNCAKHLIDKLS